MLCGTLKIENVTPKLDYGSGQCAVGILDTR